MCNLLRTALGRAAVGTTVEGAGMQRSGLLRKFVSKIHAAGGRVSILEPESWDEQRRAHILVEIFYDAGWSGNNRVAVRCPALRYFCYS